MPNLDFLFFDAGGGHRAAATALKEVCAEMHPDWNVRLVQVQELLSDFDIFRQAFGVKTEEIYNLVLRKGWTFGAGASLRGLQLLIRLYHKQQVYYLSRYWRQGPRPDLVVSLIPNFNRSIYAATKELDSSPPLVTILTDIADFPPNFWIERGQEQYFVCGSKRAEQQALEAGHARERIFRTSGMILNPRFYNTADIDRRAERERLGLDPDKPTALVMFGGFGSLVMENICEKLEASGLDLQIILICGKNAKLQAKLERGPSRLRRHVVGFTREVPYFMQLADFFIGKPGPGSISEALHMGLPVITTRNALTLPQERYNTAWVMENELGLVEANFGRVDVAVKKLLAPGVLERYQANARRLDNRAVYEIPTIFEQLLAKHTPQNAVCLV
jgi:1,2-diacylglycerol 3-beta-galactosyltransferase